MTDGRNIIPVLLGSDLGAYSTALTFRDLFGVRSHVFARERHRVTENSKFIKTHILRGIDDLSVSIPLFLKFAAENNGAELFLIPCASSYVELAERMRLRLGGIYRFFIPDINPHREISDENIFCEEIKNLRKNLDFRRF